MPTLILFAFMLIIMLMRVFVPIGVKVEGKQLARVHLSFREKVLLHRVNVYAIGFVLLLTAATGLLPSLWEVLIIFVVFAILMLPASYTLTDQGIAYNNVVFRRWKEFQAFRAEKRQVVLEAREGMRSFRIQLLAHRQGEVLSILRAQLQQAGSAPAARSKRSRSRTRGRRLEARVS